MDRLPHDFRSERMHYHLYVLQKVEAGLTDAAAGRLVPHETVAEELRRKWVTGVDP